jgi:hypothetical protein
MIIVERTGEPTYVMIMVERTGVIRAHKYDDNGGESKGHQSPQIC